MVSTAAPQQEDPWIESIIQLVLFYVGFPCYLGVCVGSSRYASFLPQSKDIKLVGFG